MEFAEVVRARHSFRGFLPKAVDEKTIKDIFELASWAPSNCNVQPWSVHVLSGDACDRMREKMVAKASTDSAGNPDFPWQGKFTGDYKARQICSALGLWEHQGVTRDNPEKRAWSWMRNFEFFDAPHIAFIFVTDEFPELVRLAGDVGMYSQTLMLAMADAGIGSCPQTSVSCFPDLVREELGIESQYKLMMGLSFGYIDESDPANKLRTERDSLDKTTHFYS
ncbi:nitroreductase [Porticoccaceae bacterium]|jgi:nitroreductase|nr:nitroreductase [Porticoccaceae bacterium]MDC0133791.1 nitroreductase [Porticoccaceae bacterium]MDC1476497.1 nitroreductase [Porticoccaceae bacterium]CAI8306250.1 MAG: Nitroreductase NfnB [SAR92 bacterium MED-G29]|tara:strand:- start:165 stop:833 length:669 start_codon:yes stop_codon:yes gene_type:complete